MWIRNKLLAPAGEDGGKGGGAVARDPELDFGDEVTDLDEQLDSDGADAGATDAGGDGGGDDAGGADDSGGGAGGDGGKDKDTVPGKRLKELLAKQEKKVRQELQAEIDELKRKISSRDDEGGRRYTPVQQLRLMEAKKEELEEKYEELVMSGKKEELKPLRQQIKQLEAGIVDFKVEMRATAAQTGAAEDVRYQVALDLIEEKYPELDADSDDYDREKDSEVSDLVDGLVAKGLAKDVALKRAVKYVLGERRAAKKESEEGAGSDDPRTQRMLDARKRAAAAAAKQPANGEGAGKTGGAGPAKIDLSKRITPEAFERFSKLDEKDRARLRGDEL